MVGMNFFSASLAVALSRSFEAVKYLSASENDAISPNGQQRVLCTTRHAAYDAKTRAGLPAEINMGDSGQEAWNNFREALNACKKGAAQTRKNRNGSAKNGRRTRK